MGQKRVKKATAKPKKKKQASRTVVELIEPRPASPLRGLLPTPPEVAEIVAEEVAKRPMSDAARQWVTDCFNMQYYFGGHPIAYRKTPQGVEVLAAGLDEIGKLMRRLPPSEDRNVIIGHPDPW
jgi:hypothetical protein